MGRLFGTRGRGCDRTFGLPPERVRAPSHLLPNALFIVFVSAPEYWLRILTNSRLPSNPQILCAELVLGVHRDGTIPLNLSMHMPAAPCVQHQLYVCRRES